MTAAKAPYHHGNLRVALVDAAWDLLRKGDVESLSLREVAKTVGVSPNAPYRHFEDKQALLAAVAERGFAELVELFKASEGMPPKLRLTAITCAYLDYATAQPAAYRVMVGKHLHNFANYPELERTASSAFMTVLEVSAGAVGCGMDDLRAVRGAMTLWAMVHGLAMLSEDCPILMTSPERMPDGEALAAVFALGAKALSDPTS